jgi:hypothetical protein
MAIPPLEARVRNTLIVILVAVALLWIVPIMAQPGPVKTYTCTWSHDGAGTDGYVVLVDGVAVPTVATCAGAGAERTCTSPVAMTTNVPHLVTVRAENIFGSADSSPFSAAPPSTRPAAVVVR